MYEYLKKILVFAEEIGAVEVVLMHERLRSVDDQIEIRGTTQDGNVFTIDLTIQEKKEDLADNAF